MNNHQIQPNPCYCACNEKQSIADVIHGRTTGYVHIYFFQCINDSCEYLFSEQQSIRDLIENKYLHEWLHKTAIRRCKEILANNTSVSKTKFLLTHHLNILFIRNKRQKLVYLNKIQIKKQTNSVRNKLNLTVYYPTIYMNESILVRVYWVFSLEFLDIDRQLFRME